MLQKRLVELSGLAYNRGIVVFSDFLNLNELNILHTALIFVKEEMAEYVTDNLTQIRHTHVKATIGTGFQVDYEPRYEELKGTVSSIRLDSVLALAYPLSRSKITSQIEAGKVFVNGKLITSNGYRLKENDIISVRKMGRIAYNGILSETKKGRYMISVRKYI